MGVLRQGDVKPTSLECCPRNAVSRDLCPLTTTRACNGDRAARSYSACPDDCKEALSGVGWNGAASAGHPSAGPLQLLADQSGAVCRLRLEVAGLLSSRRTTSLRSDERSEPGVLLWSCRQGRSAEMPVFSQRRYRSYSSENNLIEGCPGGRGPDSLPTGSAESD